MLVLLPLVVAFTDVLFVELLGVLGTEGGVVGVDGGTIGVVGGVLGVVGGVLF